MELGPHYATVIPLILTLTLPAFMLLQVKSPNSMTRAWKLLLKIIILSWIIYTIPFLTLDYTLAEVAKNSSDSLPLPIRIAVIWSGGGSSLFFFTMIAALGFLALSGDSHINKRFILLSTLFLTVTHVAAALNGAFDIMRGAGGFSINPLLTSLWIIPHPTTTFAGYALLAVGAIALYSNIRGNSIRIFILGWSLLTLGIVFGGMWSYETFGWGGYWAWDPVEISELTVWLAATMILHMMGPLSPLQSSFAPLVASSSLLATYVTRSGLSPLHSFAAENVGALLLLAGSLFFLLLTITSLSSDEVSSQVFYNIKRLIRARSLAPIMLVVGAVSLGIMTLFVYASLLAPSILTALGVEAKLPTLADGVRFYHPILFPLVLISVSAVPGYFLSRHIGALGYLGLLSLALGLSGITLAALQGSRIVLSPLSSDITRLQMAIGVPIAIIVSAALSASLVYTIVLALLGRRSLWLSLREALLKLLHLGMILTFLGVLLSGAYAFNDQYMQSYTLKPGESIVFENIQVTLEDAYYTLADGTVDLKSHVSGKTTTALYAWKGLEIVGKEIAPALSELEQGGKSLGDRLLKLLNLTSPITSGSLSYSGMGTIMGVPEGWNQASNVTVGEGWIRVTLLNPQIEADLTPQVEQGILRGGLLALALNASVIIETNHLSPSFKNSNTIPALRAAYILLEEPIRMSVEEWNIVIESLAVYPLPTETAERNDTTPLLLAEERGVWKTLGALLLITKGQLETQGFKAPLPLELGPGLLLYLRANLADAGNFKLLLELLENPPPQLLAGTAIEKSRGPQPGELNLPVSVVSGARLHLTLGILDTRSGERWEERGLIRFEANGEAIGIHGLVSDVILVDKGLGDVYINLQPPIVGGAANNYHELLVYYLKEGLSLYSPPQALALAALMASGYTIGAAQVDLLQGGRLAEQSLLDLIVLSQRMAGGDLALEEEGITILVKYIPYVDLVWAGALLMSVSGLLLAAGIGEARRQAVASIRLA